MKTKGYIFNKRALLYFINISSLKDKLIQLKAQALLKSKTIRTVVENTAELYFMRTSFQISFHVNKTEVSDTIGLMFLEVPW